MRSCGDCIACCTYFQIQDEKLHKGIMQHCPYCRLPGEPKDNMAYLTGPSCEGNCIVHNDEGKKPKTCIDYECLWLKGYGKEEDRPDKSLMIFDTVMEIKNAIEAKPLAPDAENTEESKALIRSMSNETGKPVIIVDFYQRRVKEIMGRPVGDK